MKLIAAAVLMAGTVTMSAPAQEQTLTSQGRPFLIVRTIDFEGRRTFAVFSPAEEKELQKTVRRENEAAQKAYMKVRKAWNDKYPVASTGTAGYGQPARQNTTYSKRPVFPLKTCPVKEARTVEVCESEETTAARLKFHEDLETARAGHDSAADPLAYAAPFGAGISSAFAPAKNARTAAPKPAAEDNNASRNEVMEQFMHELAGILSGTEQPNAGSASTIPKKPGLGSGTANTFPPSSLGAKK